MLDPLESLLGPPAPATPPPVPEATLRVLRRRRVARRLKRAALAACCAASLFVASVDVVPHQGPIRPPPERPVPTLPASEWEWRGAETADPGAYRVAGDRYLDEDDPASAARCYGRSLGDDLTPEADDSWLLLAIKQARRNERDP